jgi:hypothetical protein
MSEKPMAARIVNLTNPDYDGTQYGSVEEAEQALALLTKKFRSQGYTVTEQRNPDEAHPQYKVTDFDDAWVGTYTIMLQ